MAWYTTGTIAVSGTTVTGTGTNFLDNTQSIGPGQALLIPASGTVKMYEVASVQSATKLTLKTTAGTVAAGQAYAILSFYTDSVPDFARRLAAQLSYYQSQMDGWQQIMTGTGSVTLTAPDGTSVTISSFAKLTADVAAAMTDKGNLNNTIDLNTLGAAASWGVYTQTANANALATLNYPEQKAGTLLCTKAAYNGVIQTYIPFDSGAVYTRALAGNWNGTDGPWGVWKMVGASFRTQGSVDLNTFTGAQLFVGGTFTNGPSTMGNATAFIQCLANSANSLTAQIAIYTTSGRMFTRTNVSGTWTAWAESLTTNSVVAIANGGTGANNAGDARVNLLNNAINWELMNNEMRRYAFASGRQNANVQGAGVWNFNNTPFGTEQYGVCIQVNNRSDNSGSAGTGVWQHYLALGTGGNIIYARNINSTYSAVKLYSTGNTTTNSSGALVPASPIVRIVNDRDAVTRSDILGVENAEYTWSTKRGLFNEESKGCTVSRSDVGTYLVKGAAGLAKDLWTVMDCGNGQGRIIALAEAEETADGIVVRCYKQKYTLSDDGDLTIEKGTLIDIPSETWIDVRLEMPADSDYNLRQKEIADQLESQQQEESGS